MEMSISMWKSESQTSSSSRTVSRPFPSHFEKLTKNGHGRVEGRWPTYCQRRALSTVYSKVERGHFQDMTFLPYVARYQRLHDPPRSQSHRQKISVSYFRYNGFMNSGASVRFTSRPHTRRPLTIKMFTAIVTFPFSLYTSSSPSPTFDSVHLSLPLFLSFSFQAFGFLYIWFSALFILNFFIFWYFF